MLPALLDDNANELPQCPLLELPPELRDEIYAHALCSAKAYTYQSDQPHALEHTFEGHQHDGTRRILYWVAIPPLLQSSRTIRYEAFSIWSSTRIFQFNVVSRKPTNINFACLFAQPSMIMPWLRHVSFYLQGKIYSISISNGLGSAVVTHKHCHETIGPCHCIVWSNGGYGPKPDLCAPDSLEKCIGLEMIIEAAVMQHGPQAVLKGEMLARMYMFIRNGEATLTEGQDENKHGSYIMSSSEAMPGGMYLCGRATRQRAI